ncbi:unnamed protein product, partial [Musa hybrid cultivar]
GSGSGPLPLATGIADLRRPPPPSFDCRSRFLLGRTVELALAGCRRARPVASRTLAGFYSVSLAVPREPTPPSEVSSPAPTPTPSATPRPAPVPSNEEIRSGEDADQAGEDVGGGGMSGGKKAGIAVGVIMAAAVLAAGVVLYKKRQENIRRSRYGYATQRDML